MTTQRFYATFGVKYAREPHPTLPPEHCNPDGVMEVIAPDMDIARAMVSAATNNAYCFLHPWPENGSPEIAKMEYYFPAGVNCTLSVRSAELDADPGATAAIQRERLVALLVATSKWMVDDQDGWLVDALIEHLRAGDDPEVAPSEVLDQIVRAT